jgi:hypothetical protein
MVKTTVTFAHCCENLTFQIQLIVLGTTTLFELDYSEHLNVQNSQVLQDSF